MQWPANWFVIQQPGFGNQLVAGTHGDHGVDGSVMPLDTIKMRGHHFGGEVCLFPSCSQGARRKVRSGPTGQLLSEARKQGVELYRNQRMGKPHGNKDAIISKAEVCRVGVMACPDEPSGCAIEINGGDHIPDAAGNEEKAACEAHSIRSKAFGESAEELRRSNASADPGEAYDLPVSG